MEPGLGGQEKASDDQYRYAVDAWSQWSLALAARKRAAWDLTSFLENASQWSLALAARKRGSRFFACLTTSIAHLRERWEPCGEEGGLQAAEARSKCVLTRGRALPGGGGGTGALAR